MNAACLSEEINRALKTLGERKVVFPSPAYHSHHLEISWDLKVGPNGPDQVSETRAAGFSCT